MSAGLGSTRKIALIGALLVAAGAAGPAHAQVLQFNGTTGDTINYSIFNDSGVPEATVNGNSIADGTFTSTVGTAPMAIPSGTTISVSVDDDDSVPGGYVNGTTLVQPLKGSGLLTINTIPTSGTGINVLSADVTGGDIYGTAGSSNATIVFDLSSLSTGASGNGFTAPTGTAYLELTGTLTQTNTTNPATLTMMTECLTFPPIPPCSGASQLNLNPLTIDWGSGIVTTTAPSIPPPTTTTARTIQFMQASVGGSNYSWSDQNSQNNWTVLAGPPTPQPGDIVLLTNPTSLAITTQTVVNFDATNLSTTSPLTSLTIDSNLGGALVELSQAANTLASGNETIGSTGTAEHLQTGGVNSVAGTLTINGFGTYDFQGGTFSAQNITVNSGGNFFYDGGTTAPAFTGTFLLNSGGMVASGSSSSPGNGMGTEIISAPSASSNDFDQEGGTNNAGTFILGQTGGTAEYTLNGGNLNASSEAIGAGATGNFIQTGGMNSVTGTVSITSCQFCAQSTYTLGNGSDSVAQLDLNSLQVNAGTTFNLQGGGTLTAGNDLNTLGTETVLGTFVQSGLSTNGLVGPQTPGTLTIGSAGIYDLQGDQNTVLIGYVAVNSGGKFFFDGGKFEGVFTLNSGGVVASGTAATPGNGSGTETIADFFGFQQLGGTNTTALLTVGKTQAGSIGDFGTYDLQGGVLNVGTITVNLTGDFYFDGGTANFTTFNQLGGTVASGTAGSLAGGGIGDTGNPANYGTGTEIISSSTGETFNQSSGSNSAGTLIIGQTAGQGLYKLMGGTLTATSEMVGAGGLGGFIQTGGTNTVGTLTVTACGCFTGFGVSIDSSYTLGGASSQLTVTNLMVNAGATFNLQDAGVLQQSGAGSETILGNFIQTGGTNSGNVVVGSGGTYDLQGGDLFNANVTVNSGGALEFDGSNTFIGLLTLNNGGMVTSTAATSPANSELVVGDSTFQQLGGTNTTGTLTVGRPPPGTSRIVGNYDLQGGTLNVGTILINGGGNFYFDGGAANFTIFNQVGGTVASGTATSLASGFNPVLFGDQGNTGNFGTGTENISPSEAGGTVTFNQSGGNNYAGTLLMGQTVGQSNYNLSGGQLMASTETIGGVGNATFMQTNGGNTVSGQLMVGQNSSYDLSFGTLNAGSETITGIGATFLHIGDTNTVTGALTIGSGGLYALSKPAGAPFNTGFSVGSLAIQAGGTLNISDGGQGLVLGNATNAGNLTIDGTLAAAVLTVDGTYTQTGSGSKTLLNGGMLDPTSINISAGTFGGTGTVVGDMNVTGGTIQVGDAPGPLDIMGDYTQTSGEIIFEIDPDGMGGFDVGTLVLEAGKSVTISDTNIVLDFLDGADPLAFLSDGLLKIDTFFKESDGSPFSGDFNLSQLFATDPFDTNDPSLGVNFNPVTDALTLVQQQNVPEPGSWWMLLSGIGLLIIVVRHRPAGHRRA